ncbi:MAG: cell division protein ZapA [Pseudomonadota bacterium]
MADLTLDIGGRSYPVTCRDGEQEHIQSLAAMIDDQLRKASAGGPAMTEVRGLLFASLFLADALKEKEAQLAQATSENPMQVSAKASDAPTPAVPAGAIRALESLAERVEALAEALEKPTAKA